MGQQSGDTSPDEFAHSNRMRLAIHTLSAPRKYLRPWYIAYLLLGTVTAGVLPVLLPLTIESLSHRLATVAYVMGAYNLGLLTSPLWGALAERLRLYRQLFVWSFLLTALAIAAVPVLHEFWSWMASAFAIGAGSGGAATLATLLVIDFAPRTEWESRIGWLQSFNASGQVVGLLMAAPFSSGQWAAGLWVAAALLAPAMLVGGMGLPPSGAARWQNADPHDVHPHLNVRALSIFPKLDLASGVAAHIYRLNWQGLRQIPHAIGTPFGRFLLSWFMLALAVAALFSYFPLMFAHSYGIAVDFSARIYAAAAALSIALYVLTSHLASRYGAGRLYRAGLMLRIGGFTLLWAPFLTLMEVKDGTALGVAGFVLIVVAWPLISVSGTELAARLTPFSEGAAVGLLNAALALATAIGTLISGPLVHHWGYGIIPLTALAGLVISLLLAAEGEPKRQ